MIFKIISLITLIYAVINLIYRVDPLVLVSCLFVSIKTNSIIVCLIVQYFKVLNSHVTIQEDTQFEIYTLLKHAVGTTKLECSMFKLTLILELLIFMEFTAAITVSAQLFCYYRLDINLVGQVIFGRALLLLLWVPVILYFINFIYINNTCVAIVSILIINLLCDLTNDMKIIMEVILSVTK